MAPVKVLPLLGATLCVLGKTAPGEGAQPGPNATYTVKLGEFTSLYSIVQSKQVLVNAEKMGLVLCFGAKWRRAVGGPEESGDALPTASGKLA